MSGTRVGNHPRIHRNPGQFTWRRFNHNNESQSHNFRNSPTHRYFQHNKLLLIAWSSPFDSPQYAWNLTHIIIKWLTFSIISTISIRTQISYPLSVHLTVPWTYQRSWANYLAINVAIKLKYHKAKRIKIYYEICTHTIGAQFPTPKW